MNPYSNKEYFHTGKSLIKNESNQDLRDANLIAQLTKSDENALERLYSIYYGRLFRFIGRLTQHENVIDEIINDVMFVVWEKASTYDGQSKVSTWIFGIAFNKARQALRNNSQYELSSLEDINEDSEWLGKQDAGIHQLELDDLMASALNQLSVEHRTVIELTYFEGMHYSEIAKVMDCPENTIKTRMLHARKNLAKILTANHDNPKSILG